MRESLPYDSMWQGMETRISYSRRHPLTLPDDRRIEGLIVAGLGYVAYQFLSGMPFHPAATDAPSVSRPHESRGDSS